MTKNNYATVKAGMAKNKAKAPKPAAVDPANNGPISPASNMVQDKPSPGLMG